MWYVLLSVAIMHAICSEWYKKVAWAVGLIGMSMFSMPSSSAYRFSRCIVGVTSNSVWLLCLPNKFVVHQDVSSVNASYLILVEFLVHSRC